MTYKYTIYCPRFVADNTGNSVGLPPSGVAEHVYAMIVSKFGGLTKHEFCRGFFKIEDTVIDELVEVIEIVVSDVDDHEFSPDIIKICEHIKKVYNQNCVLTTRTEVCARLI